MVGIVRLGDGGIMGMVRLGGGGMVGMMRLGDGGMVGMMRLDDGGMVGNLCQCVCMLYVCVFLSKSGVHDVSGVCEKCVCDGGGVDVSWEGVLMMPVECVKERARERERGSVWSVD